MDATSHAPGLYYKHSGRFSSGGALRALLFGLLVGLPTAWVYAWLIYWNPFVYISFIATFGFGALVGIVTETFLASGKCRNVLVTALVTFVVMLVSYYVSWAVWLHALTEKLGTIQLLLQPLGMWEIIEKVNEMGAWKLRSTVVKGEALWAVWGLEAIVLFGTALYAAVSTIQRATFCEPCERTTTAKEGIGFVAAGATPDLESKNAVKACLGGLKQHAADLMRQLKTRNFSALERLGPVPETALAWYRVDFNTCEKCDKTNTLRVVQFQRKLEGDKVKDDTEETEVLRQLILNPTEAGSIKAMGKKLVPLMPKLAEDRAKPSGADTEKPAGN